MSEIRSAWDDFVDKEDQRLEDEFLKNLRDKFAMAALSSGIADDYQSQPIGIAIRAYEIADAMMKEREKQNEKD